MIQPFIYTEPTAEEFRHNPCWRATISDGRSAYSHNSRRSWLELKEYLRENPQLWLEGLYLQFRDNVIEIACGAREYFFANSVQAFYGGPTQYRWLAGYKVGSSVLVKTYIVPELVFVSEECRSLDDEIIQMGLITNESTSLRQM